MSSGYKSTNLGQALQNTKLLHSETTVIETIKKYWCNIVPEFMLTMVATKYVQQTGSLYVDTHVPVIYIEQYAKNVQQLINIFLGGEVIKKIKFMYKRNS